MKLSIKLTLLEDVKGNVISEWNGVFDLNPGGKTEAVPLLDSCRRLVRRELIRRGLIVASPEDSQRLR